LPFQSDKKPEDPRDDEQKQAGKASDDVPRRQTAIQAWNSFIILCPRQVEGQDSAVIVVNREIASEP
jgi:hypothetical protein